MRIISKEDNWKTIEKIVNSGYKYKNSTIKSGFDSNSLPKKELSHFQENLFLIKTCQEIFPSVNKYQ